MEISKLREEFISGTASLVIGLTVTSAVSVVVPTQDLHWALTAVAFASFFSGFFGSYYAEE